MTRSAWLRVLAFLAVGAVLVAPVWTSPVLATNDGPSHVYNAALAAGVRAGRAPFATYFQLQGGLRPNMASQDLLVFLAPRVGWDAAERVVVTLAMVATFGTLLALMGPAGSTVAALLAPLAGWLASSWFVWGGAYDFALSIPCFVGLLAVLRRPRTRLSDGVVLLLLALLYVTHFFAFAVGVGLVLAVVGWRAMAWGEPWDRLLIALPGVAWLIIEMLSGGTGTGALLWREPWEALRGLIMGDFVVSVSPLDVIGGAVIMGSVWAVATLRWRALRRTGRSALAGEEVFGLGLLVLSLVAPHGVGEGTYIPIRMRYLGTLALVPAIAGAAAALRPARLAVLTAVLTAALVVHSALLVGDARRTARDVVLIDRLLAAAGAGEGSWVTTRLTMYRRGLFHVAGYRHLVGRVAVYRNLVVLDNYEALYGVFSTVWRGTPDWLQFRQSTTGLTVRLAPGSIRWPGGVFVLHESGHALQITDPRLALGASFSGGAFAVTLVRRLH